MVGKIIAKRILWRWGSHCLRELVFIFMKRMFLVRDKLLCVKVLKIVASQRIHSLMLGRNKKFKKVKTYSKSLSIFYIKQRRNSKATQHYWMLEWQDQTVAQTANLKPASSHSNNVKSNQQHYVSNIKKNKKQSKKHNNNLRN